MYQRHELSNGIQIVAEKIPYVQSISIGVWIKVGSRNENNLNNGVSHLIEHMLFKGTNKRTARQIAEEIDGVGGQLNAFTTRETTCYYVKILNNHLSMALDVLSDMMMNSQFSEEELNKERSVILEEISMYEDSPEDQVHDLFSHMVFKDHSLGLNTLGTKESLLRLNKENILEFFYRNYHPKNIIIAVAGNFQEVKLMEELEKYFGHWKGKNHGVIKEDIFPIYTENTMLKNKETEQIHLNIGMEGISQTDERLFPLLIIDNILGGGMSSRLFQRIREENGLAYSIFTYPSIYSDIGLYNIYTGTNAFQLENVIHLIMDELYFLERNGISKKELFQSKEQLKGNYILGLESTSSRMNAIGKSQLLTNRILTPNEIIKKIDNIQMEDIEGVIHDVFCQKKLSFAAVGKMEESNFHKLIK